jgi:hypothetical protein
MAPAAVAPDTSYWSKVTAPPVESQAPPDLDFVARPSSTPAWSSPLRVARPVRRRRETPLWVWAAIAAVICGAGAFTTVLLIGHTQKKEAEVAISARDEASDGAAKASLSNALVAEKTYYLDKSAYTADVTTLRGIESSISWTNGAARQGEVSVSSDGASVVVSAVSLDGVCWSEHVSASSTDYAAGTGSCAASQPPGTFGPSWPAPTTGPGGGGHNSGGSGGEDGGSGGNFHVPTVPTAPVTTLPS